MTPERAAPRPEFTSLIDRYGGEIFAYLYRYTGGTMDAEDCLQETLLRAFRAYTRTAPDSNFRAWLYAIATNVARTHHRRRLRTLGREQPLEADLPTSGASPAQLAEQRLALAAVREAVAGLPEKQRAALILRKYQGLGYAEIGQLIACSPESARANVYQALRSLRLALKDGGAG